MSNDKDLFAPPSQEELDSTTFAAPTEDELKTFKEPKEPQKYTTKQALAKGAVQGATFGFGDELSGLTNSGLDKVQSLLNKLGLSSPSPSQVDASLRQQGFTGSDLLDDKNNTMYTQARDQERMANAAAQAQHPFAYGTGEVGGSIATTMIPGGAGAKLIQPFGSAVEGAGIMAKAGRAALNAAPVGALIGAGTSNSEGMPELASDALHGAETGALFGAGGDLLGQGASFLVNKGKKVFKSSFPVLSDELSRGLEGINTGSDEFKNQVNQNIVDELKNPISGILKTARDYKNMQNQKLIDGADKQISEVTANLTDEMNTIKNALVNSKESERRSLMKQINDHAVKTQTELGKVKQNVGSIYDKLENQIENKGITFNVNNELDNFGQNLVAGGVDPSEAQRLLKPFTEKYEKTNLTLPELRDVKNKLSSLFDNSRGEIRKAAKQAYGQINDNQVNTLATQGDTDLAKNLLDTNQKYKSILQLEEDFIGQIKPNPITKTIEPSNEMLNTIKSYSTQTPSPKDFRTQEEFNKLTNIADPNFANQTDEATKLLANKLQANENLNVSGPSLSDMQANSQQMQDLLNYKNSLTNTKPNITNQFDKLTQPNVTDKQIGDEVLNNFEQVLNPIKTSKTNDFENLLNEYKKSTGKDLTPVAKRLAEDARIVESRNKGATGMSFSSIGGIKSLGQGPANMAGRTINNVDTIFNTHLPDLYNKLKMQGSKEAQVYAKQIETAINNGTEESKNAVLFSLMQQPNFRQMMNINSKDSNK